MRVLEINVDDVGLGGVFQLVRNVIMYKPEGLDIDIAGIVEFEHPENVAQLNERGTQIFYIGTHGPKFIRPLVYYIKTRRLIRRRGYNCVHIHGDVAYLLLIFGLAAKRAGVRRIVMHSHAAGIDGGLRKLKFTLHRMCRPFLKRVGTKFAACSDAATRWMYPAMLPEDIVMVRNGIDLDKFRFDPQTRERIRRKLGWQDAVIIGHVGRFAYQKNHEYLLKVFDHIHRDMESARLLLVGEGPLKAAMEAKVRELGLSDAVLFYGTSGHVEQLMQAMDILLLPSHFEGLPIVGVEAQASGLPVLFSEQITREANLSKHCAYLPINDGSVWRWHDQVSSWVVNTYDRAGVAERLEKKGYSINQTVRTFAELYGMDPDGGTQP